jgi:hypothetical protein
MSRPQVKQVSDSQSTFFDYTKARWSDPETSRPAAESMSLERLTRQELVLAGLRIVGPSADEQLIASFRSRWPPWRVSNQSIRSRRAKLVRKGL